MYFAFLSIDDAKGCTASGGVVVGPSATSAQPAPSAPLAIRPIGSNTSKLHLLIASILWLAPVAPVVLSAEVMAGLLAK